MDQLVIDEIKKIKKACQMQKKNTWRKNSV